jgi:hypothetical protein
MLQCNRFIVCNGLPGSLNIDRNFLLRQFAVRVIVSFFSLILQFSKSDGKVFYRIREARILPEHLFATIKCLVVMQCAIDLCPSLFASGGALAPDERVSRITRQAMEHGVVDSAMRTSQIGLTGSTIPGLKETFRS